MKNADKYFATELDGKHIWQCQECNFFSYSMYHADSHQCETDHCMKRTEIEKEKDD